MKPRRCAILPPMAEVLALRRAAARVGNHRLGNCVLVVTLEPCLMCAGAIREARVRGVVYGARDERAGAVESRLEGLAYADGPAPWHMGGVESGRARNFCAPSSACAGIEVRSARFRTWFSSILEHFAVESICRPGLQGPAHRFHVSAGDWHSRVTAVARGSASLTVSADRLADKESRERNLVPLNSGGIPRQKRSGPFPAVSGHGGVQALLLEAFHEYSPEHP